MKRTVLVLLVAILGLGLVACGDDPVQTIGEELGLEQPCIDGVKAMLDAAQVVAGTLDDDIEDVDDLRSRSQAFVDAAPEAIRADVETVFDDLAEYMRINDDDPDAASALLETESYTAATDRIQAWLSDNCNVETSTTLG